MRSEPIFEGLPPDPTHLVPGSFFLRKIEGWTGRWVSAGQAFMRGGSNWTHAGLILDNYQIIEAEPGGAKIKSVTTLWEHEPVMISDAPIRRWAETTNFPMVLGAAEEAELDKRSEVVGKARYMEGVPYSIVDYLAITMAELWRTKKGKRIGGWLADRVEESGHLICSALVDRAYAWSEVHLFDDGRLPGLVTPFDLEQYVLHYEGERMSRRVAATPVTLYEPGEDFGTFLRPEER